MIKKKLTRIQEIEQRLKDHKACQEKGFQYIGPFGGPTDSEVFESYAEDDIAYLLKLVKGTKPKKKSAKKKPVEKKVDMRGVTVYNSKRTFRA